MYRFTLFLALFSCLTHAGSLTTLSPLEQRDVDSRLNDFYENNDPLDMSRPSPKFSIRLQKYVSPHPELKLKPEAKKPTNPLLQVAQVKGTPEFDKYYCENFLRKHFPKVKCGKALDERTLSFIENNDKAEELAYNWTSVSHNLDQIPTIGRSTQPLWSDDYWRVRWGITSFRYSKFEPGAEFPTWKIATNSYYQPQDWNTISSLPLRDLSQKVSEWSPSEKYDVSVGDVGFTLTREQKAEGKSQLGEDGNVEAWMGICHGWAPAAFMVERPIQPVKVIGTNGVEVNWNPNDIKSMITLAWANGNYATNNAGERCYDKKPKLLPNGRLEKPGCWDTNPATFHLALGNMIGRRKVSFVYDKSFDYEVWNQPIVSYEFTYFNPLDRSQRSKDWKAVAVPYDAAFKASDRFQKPLTRGKRGSFFSGNDDSQIKQIVGVITTVVYVTEYTPEWQTTPQADEYERESYSYDLEIVDNQGTLEVEGGEWHTNVHPDFLWVPEPDSTASVSDIDLKNVKFEGDKAPTAELTDLAARGSSQGYPLCSFIKEMIKRSTGRDTYHCPTP
jgi:hypothetical protein